VTGVGFHGSYAAADVTFLLQPLALQPIQDVLEKERLIQSGAKHYSEMLGREQLPSAHYLELFYAAVSAFAERMARDVLRLTRRIRAARPGAVTLVSLARAGTPIGVLLRRALADVYGVDAPHYSVSIIRDRGLDAHALDYILGSHSADSLVFVDGWTAKGTIASELHRSLQAYQASRGTSVPADLFVLCDLAGLAFASGSADDYLIPSALLNATVSGLVSRTILNHMIAADQFHGCVFHVDWQTQDLSQWFITQIEQTRARYQSAWLSEPLRSADRAALRQRSANLIATLMQRHDVKDPQFIKPGIGEATRALLRRAPGLLLLRDPDAAEVRHLVQLANERKVAVQTDATMDLHAVAIIRRLANE